MASCAHHLRALSHTAAVVLDVDARAYRDKRNIIDRPRHAYFTDGFYRQGMRGCFIGLARLLTKFAGIDLTALLNGKTDAPERRQALLFHSPLAHLITATPALLFSLGLPPQQRALLGAGAPLNEVLHERLLRLVNGHPDEVLCHHHLPLRSAILNHPNDRRADRL